MKKIFSIFAAALMSASMFAALEPAPDDATLNGYKAEGDNVVFAIYVEDSIKCNDIAFAGTYKMKTEKDWETDASLLAKFQPVSGYAGWYVVCFKDTSASVEGKPAQLDGLGKFNWDYQVGQLSQENVVRGIATIEAGFTGECNIKEISTSAPVLVNVTCWKTNPCTVKYHDYIITFISPDCNAEDYVVPAISGGFNGWAQQAMTIDDAATAQRQRDQLLGAVFKDTVHAAEGSNYKFRSSEEWGKDWTNELKEFNTESGEWQAFNGGQNFAFGTTTEIEYDLGDPTAYTWTNCEKPIECDSMDYTITVKFPVCAEAAPNVIGSFCGWNGGVAMTATANPNEYTAIVRALCNDQFKFNDAVQGWGNEVEKFNGTEWKGADNIDFGTEAAISVDYSDAATYRWKACATPIIEVKAANASAKKVLVNGQMLIIRDGAQFNVLGTEVK